MKLGKNVDKYRAITIWLGIEKIELKQLLHTEIYREIDKFDYIVAVALVELVCVFVGVLSVTANSKR